MVGQLLLQLSAQILPLGAGQLVGARLEQFGKLGREGGRVGERKVKKREKKGEEEQSRREGAD